MNKKAKCDIFCEGLTYYQGNVYAPLTVAHLDQADFSDTDEAVTESLAVEEISDETEEITESKKKVSKRK